MATVNDKNTQQNEIVENFGDDAIEFKDFKEKWPNFEFKDDQFSDIDSITDMGRPRGMSKRVKALFIVLILLLLGAASAAAVFAIQSTNDGSGDVSSSVGNDEKSDEVDVTVFGFSNPSPSPSEIPSGHPTRLPSVQPSNVHSNRPSLRPSNVHSNRPSLRPSNVHSDQPSYNPTNIPSLNPTVTPSLMPTGAPSFDPTAQPSLEPTALPSDKPSLTITLIPTIDNTENPTVISSSSPSMYVQRIWLEQMLSFLNDARSDEGASPLCFNQKLINAAIYHVNDMYQNDFVSTTGSDNSTMVDRAELFGYEVDQIAQTAFRGYDNVEDVVDDLLDEDYNLRRFVVDADYIHVGLAMREGFWTQVFASSHDEDESCIDVTI